MKNLTKAKYLLLIILINTTIIFSQSNIIDPRQYNIADEFKQEIFFDDFNTNSNNWTMVIDERSFRKIENGYLCCWSHFTNEPQFWKSAFSLKPFSINEEKDFEIETAIKCSQFGVSPIPLIWGRNSATLHTHYFGFYSNSDFQITKFENNAFTFFNTPTKIPEIKINDYNKLTIRKKDKTLYFFINEKLVYEMPYIKFPGEEIGFQAPSHSIIYADFLRISYIGELNYEKKIRSMVVSQVEPTLKRGKFEKQEEYKVRVGPNTRNKLLEKKALELIDSFGNLTNPYLLHANDYDPDAETFKLLFKNNDSISLKVPNKEAQIFDANFTTLQLNPKYTLEDNKFKLLNLEINDKQAKKTYAYKSNKAPYDLKKLFPEIYKTDTVLIPKSIIVAEVAKAEVDFKKKLNELTAQMITNKEITENVKTNVNAKMVETKDTTTGKSQLNYQVTYSYEVIKTVIENKTDDFPPGRYKVSNSNAAKMIMKLLKETVEKELAKFLTAGTKLTIRITGSTDASPIAGSIKYDGEYGSFNDEDYMINNRLSTITINQNEGITTNEQLAFLRTYSVRQYIETYIDPLRTTENNFQHYCVVSKEKGGQYRKIAVELTIHNAFKGKKTKELFDNKQKISDVDVEIPENKIVKDNHFALIIGNEDYNNEIKVPFATNDASTFKEYCLKTLGIPNNHIHYLENATFGQMQAEVKWLTDIIRVFRGESNIIIYYAGHGMPDENTKNSFLLPIDGSASISATALSLTDFYEKLQKEKTKSITVFLDACFSGTSREGTLVKGRGVVLKPKPQQLNNNIIVFSASSDDETALPYLDKNHGLFTYYLLKTLKETKGFCNYENLFNQIKTNVNQQSILINQKTQSPSINISADFNDLWKIMKIN